MKFDVGREGKVCSSNRSFVAMRYLDRNRNCETCEQRIFERNISVQKVCMIFVKYFGCIPFAQKKTQYPGSIGWNYKSALNRNEYYDNIGSHKNNESTFITAFQCFG